jgi:predicted P-loop ATPase
MAKRQRRRPSPPASDRLGVDSEFGEDTRWLDRFRRDDGKIGGSEATLLGILNACPQTAGGIGYNTRRGRLEALRKGPWGEDGAWSSTMTAAQVIYFQRLGIPACVGRFDTALAVFAEGNCFDPLLDYLNGLHWEGKPLIDTWLIKYAGAKDTPLNRFIGAKFLIAMVARAMVPGCQCDYALCLEGAQGIGKSQIARVLGGEYRAEDLMSFQERDAQQIASSHWLIEVAELAAVKRSDLERYKAFITTTQDTYVPKYERYPITRKRWCVFLFTVNPDGAGYLADSTGNRRIWPVTIVKVDIEGLKRDRDQLFAEALHRYRKGEAWWPEGKMPALSAAQAARMIEDAWTPQIAKWLAREIPGEPPRPSLTTFDVLTGALRMRPGDIDNAHAIRVGRILKTLKYERYQERKGEKRGFWFYRRGTKGTDRTKEKARSKTPSDVSVSKHHFSGSNGSNRASEEED